MSDNPFLSAAAEAARRPGWTAYGSDWSEELGFAPPLRVSGLTPMGFTRGGMSLVYRARDERHGGTVVVKRLKPELLRETDAVRRFVRECYIWLLLADHPNIVDVTHVSCVPPEPPTLFMPLLPASLRAVLVGALPVPRALEVAIAICDALAYGASIFSDFAHGDLKPENILVDARATPQVADFGLARATRSIGGDGAGGSEPDGHPAGTPVYMAPEIIQRGETSLASDVYALGCLMHEMLVGAPVFARATGVSEVLRAHLDGRPPSLRDIDRSIPATLATLVLGCLDKNPRNRPTIRVLGAHLRDLAAEHGLHVRIPTVTANPVNIGEAVHGLSNLGFHHDAIQLAETVLADHGTGGTGPSWTELRIRVVLTRCYREVGRLAEAEDQSRQAERALPTVGDHDVLRVAHLNEKALLRSAMGDHSQAVDILRESIRLMPQSSPGWANLGATYRDMGDYAAAIAAFERALAVSANLAYFLCALHCALSETAVHPSVELAEKARSLGVDAVQQHPDEPLAIYCRLLGRLVAIYAWGGAGDVPDERQLLDAKAVLDDLRLAAQVAVPAELMEIVRDMAARIALEPRPVAVALSERGRDLVHEAEQRLAQEPGLAGRGSRTVDLRPLFGARPANRLPPGVAELFRRAAVLYGAALELLAEGSSTDRAVLHHQLGNVHGWLHAVPESRHHYLEAIRLHDLSGAAGRAEESREDLALLLANAGRGRRT